MSNISPFYEHISFNIMLFIYAHNLQVTYQNVIKENYPVFNF